MQNKSFWAERVKEFGHTGWSDQVIYAFDQPNRIGIVKYFISRYMGAYGGAERNLLDFGCGSGEFTSALYDKFTSHVMYDTCEEVLRQYRMVSGTKDRKYHVYNEFKKDSMVYDVILSITVLQHILDDSELDSVLETIREKMRDDSSIFIVMESFLDERLDYIRKWTYCDFIRLFESHGYRLLKGYNYYKNTVYNDVEYQKYVCDLRVRFLARIHNHVPSKKVKKIVFQMLKHIANNKKTRADGMQFLSELTPESGYKFFIFKKA